MPRSVKPKTPFISRETISRRSLLDWIGKATVLALGGELASACTSGRAVLFHVDGGEEPFPFVPGPTDLDVYDGWGERTVDRQDLEAILSSWRLRVDGRVEHPFELSFAELIGLPRQDQVTDLHCVEGWSIYDVPWNGVHLSTIVERARPTAQATHVAFHTIGGTYNESLPMDVALEPRTLLAYGIGGSTLPLKHGFPVRIVIPRLLAYKSAKFVERIEFTDQPLYGYWVAAGYPYGGEVPEGRLRPGKY
jgi:DMSO/TMAO reductase YedYZ molybdopterin-dependent catalytic subunit